MMMLLFVECLSYYTNKNDALVAIISDVYYCKSGCLVLIECDAVVYLH